VARNQRSGLDSLAARTDDAGAADGLRVAVDLLAFGCELWMLATLALSGWGLGNGGLLGICLAIFYPAVAIAIWAAWLAPRGRGRIADPWRFMVQVAMFAGTGIIAALARHIVLGVVFAVVSVGVFGMVRVLDPTSWPHPQPPSRGDTDADGIDLFDDRSDT
jgi:hypothetical protein